MIAIAVRIAIHRAVRQGYFCYDALLYIVILIGAGNIAASASGAVVGAAMPALIACELAAMPGILTLGYLIT